MESTIYVDADACPVVIVDEVYKGVAWFIENIEKQRILRRIRNLQ